VPFIFLPSALAITFLTGYGMETWRLHKEHFWPGVWVAAGLGYKRALTNLPAGSVGRDLSLHRHTSSTRLENWRRIECWKRTTNLSLLNARMALMMLTQATSVRARRGVEPPVAVTSVTVVDVEVGETGSGGPG
jgi:hypothetical protein